MGIGWTRYHAYTVEQIINFDRIIPPLLYLNIFFLYYVRLTNNFFGLQIAMNDSKELKLVLIT